MSARRPHEWTRAQIDEAIAALAAAAGMRAAHLHATATADVALAARRRGLSAEPVDASLRDLPGMLGGVGPAIIVLEDGVLALLRATKRHATLVGPSGVRRVAVAELVHSLAAPIEAPLVAPIDAFLERAGIPQSRRARARAGLIEDRAGARRVSGVWMLRLPASAPFADQLRAAGVMRGARMMFATHFAQYALAMLGWWAIGGAALEGRIDHGWLFAWALLLLTLVPLRLAESMLQGRVSIEAASLLKRRLLVGALRLEPEEMRGEGAGQQLGRTLEAGTVESLALSRGVSSITACIDLVVAAVVLSLGAAPIWNLVALAACVALLARAVLGYFRAHRAWTDERLHLTHDLVERMVGHRTRVAQQASDDWYDADDVALASYFGSSKRLDRSSVALTSLVTSLWFVVGLATLMPAITIGGASASALAVSIGGVLLAFRALRSLALGSRDIVAVVVAWRRVSLLFESGAREEGVAKAVPVAPPAGSEPLAEAPVLSAQNVVFRYRSAGEPVLRGCTLRVGTRDRVILEGPSGGGKSTLALVLAGVRVPESGTLLVDGLDRHTIGLADWRRRVVAVPQFHENHVVSSTFAFNVLMGREWPPSAADMREADAVCTELGLGDLIARMPGGLQQVVGETGWQLSHGERSRLYIARALLQSPKVVVLDESFAALDPETMQRAFACVAKRAPALVVVAHP